MNVIQADLEPSWRRSATAGLWKDERVLASPQGPEVRWRTGARCWCSAPTTTSGSRATPR